MLKLEAPWWVQQVCRDEMLPDHRHESDRRKRRKRRRQQEEPEDSFESSEAPEPCLEPCRFPRPEARPPLASSCQDLLPPMPIPGCHIQSQNQEGMRPLDIKQGGSDSGC